MELGEPLAALLAAGAVAGAAPLDRVTELVSAGPRDGAADSADVGSGAELSDDARTAAFETAEPLTPDDGDGEDDVFLRSGGATILAPASKLCRGLREPGAAREPKARPG